MTNLASDSDKLGGNRQCIDPRFIKFESRVKHILRYATEHDIQDLKILTAISKTCFNLQHEAAGKIAAEALRRLQDG